MGKFTEMRVVIESFKRPSPIGVAFLLALSAISASAQVKTGPITAPPATSSPAAAPQTAGQPASRGGIPPPAPLVNLDVLVTDEDGVVLAGLKQQDFRILDNGKRQTIEDFQPVGAPITIVMLLEYSANAYNYFAYKSASWGTLFLNYLEPQDYLALVTYDFKPAVRVDFTRNKAEVQQALATLAYPGFHEANLYDAVTDTLDQLDHVKGKKAILLIGTGANTFSHGNLDEVLRRIRESDAIIFTIGVAEAEYQSSGGSSLAYLQSKNAMETFAKVTGGMSWFPRFEGEIPGILHSVATHLRGQYRLGFSPASSQRDGKYHKLKVEIVGPDGKALVVTNAKGKRRKVEVYARQGYTARKEEPGR